MTTLVIRSGPESERVTLEREMTIGREGADITIADEEASRRHAMLRPVPDGVEVTDLGSLNGTTVDGGRVDAPRVAGDRSTIQIGNTIITVELPVQATAARAVPHDPERTAVRSIDELQPTAVRKQQPVPAPEEPAAAPPPEEPAAAPPPEGEPPAPPAPPAPVRIVMGFIFGAGPERIKRRMLTVVGGWTLFVAAVTFAIDFVLRH